MGLVHGVTVLDLVAVRRQDQRREGQDGAARGGHPLVTADDRDDRPEQRADERAPVLVAALFFFCVLTALMVLRPAREALGMQRGIEAIRWLFVGTVIVTLLVNPVFGLLVSRLRRLAFTSATYLFFVAGLLGFHALLVFAPAAVGERTGQVFYVWFSVFNLFATMLFWALMADRFTLEQSKRLFGLIAVVFTGSRGPLLAALPLLVIAIIMMPGRRLRLVMAALGTAILVSVLAVVLFTDAGARLRVAAETVVTALSAESKGDPAVGGRLALYAAGLSAFVDAPVAGYGWEQRLAAAYARVPGGEAAITSADPMMRGNHHLHADLLDFGVGAGLLGLAAYALFLAAPFAGAVASQRDGQREARMLGAALLSAAFFSCGLSYIMIGYEFPTTLYVVAAAILLGLCGDRRT